MAKTFVFELDNRVDGEVNSSVKGYSSKAIAMSEFYKRCGVAVASTDFTSVVLEVCGADGKIYDRKILETAYEPLEPEEGDGE